MRATREAVALLGVGVESIRCDVAKPIEVEAMADRAWERFGAVHLLFNNGAWGSRALWIFRAAPCTA